MALAPRPLPMRRETMCSARLFALMKGTPPTWEIEAHMEFASGVHHAVGGTLVRRFGGFDYSNYIGQLP